jgi:hypothetical protein
MVYRAFQQGLELIHERYLQDQELAVIENYVNTFPVRVQAHNLLKSQQEQLLNSTLREFAKTESAMLDQYRQVCLRDLQLVLTMIAHVVITDDVQRFNDSLLWVQNMMRSVKKEAYAAKGYKLLQSAIAATLPAPCVEVINPYLNQAIAMVSLPV